MKENLKPIFILLGFVGSVVLVFLLETTFLGPGEKEVPGTAAVAPVAEKEIPMGEMKEVFEDFEKAPEGQGLETRHVFTYGSINVAGTRENTKGKGYSGHRAVKVTWTGQNNFGGWGKGIGHYYNIDPAKDHLNFFVLYPSGTEDVLKIVLQDDDNGNGSYEEDKDDAFFSEIRLKPSPDWQLFSIPVRDLQDQTSGGDGVLNTAEGQGHLITFLFEFTKVAQYNKESVWYFDHINLTKGPINIGKDISEIPVSMTNLYK